VVSYFFDSSALVKRYATETGSAWVESLTDPRVGNRIYVAAITHVEVVAAIARKRKGLLISTTDATAAIVRFEHDLEHDLRVFDLTPKVMTTAAQLADKHALRGYDSVQLAVALEINVARTAQQLPSLILISSDAELNAAAQTEQLVTDDPNQH
jgi:predicted nucleic acid-binding protein